MLAIAKLDIKEQICEYRYKVAFMSGSYLAKVRHVYINHKVSLVSVYNKAGKLLLSILWCIQSGLQDAQRLNLIGPTHARALFQEFQ